MENFSKTILDLIIRRDLAIITALLPPICTETDKRELLRKFGWKDEEINYILEIEQENIRKGNQLQCL